MQLNPKTTEELKMLRAVMLDERTKTRLRDELNAYVDLHAVSGPLPVRVAVRSPFSYMFSRAGASVLAFAVLLLVGGTGVSYAAEGTVPGNTLYPVKVAVIEPIQGALITTAKGQAAWHANLASRRLDEATTLAVANKLDPATQEYLQTKFNTEVDASNADANALAATGNDSAALDVRSDLEARITAHAEILAVITNHMDATASSTASTTFESTKTLLAAVQERRHQVTEARLALEDSTLASTTVRVAVASPVADSASTTVAVATFAPHPMRAAKIRMPASVLVEPTTATLAVQAENDAQDAARTSEVASILLQHAALLRAYGPIATTSTSTMATTTVVASTTIEIQK
ncbi:MAG: hypothetical protein JWM39_530 [Parcubacteria group bacterium]|nr:hypothetical protein [Parcubacteria group bacterium]